MDRGASETIGFVLVFAVVTATIGAVYATGFENLAVTQDAEQTENVERAFDVLDDNLEDLYRRGAPSRATEIKLAGGSLSVGDSISITIATNSTAAGSCNATRTQTISPRPFVYEEGDTEIRYVAGALFRTDDGGTAMLSSPGWLVDADRMVLPLITTIEGDGTTNIGGRTTVLVVAMRTSHDLTCDFTNPDTTLEVNVTVESPRAGAWERYFEDRGFDINKSTSTVVAAEFNTSELYVSSTVVEIEIEP